MSILALSLLTGCSSNAIKVDDKDYAIGNFSLSKSSLKDKDLKGNGKEVDLSLLVECVLKTANSYVDCKKFEVYTHGKHSYASDTQGTREEETEGFYAYDRETNWLKQCSAYTIKSESELFGKYSGFKYDIYWLIDGHYYYKTLSLEETEVKKIVTKNSDFEVTPQCDPFISQLEGFSKNLVPSMNNELSSCQYIDDDNYKFTFTTKRDSSSKISYSLTVIDGTVVYYSKKQTTKEHSLKDENIFEASTLKNGKIKEDKPQDIDSYVNNPNFG